MVRVRAQRGMVLEGGVDLVSSACAVGSPVTHRKGASRDKARGEKSRKIVITQRLSAAGAGAASQRSARRSGAGGTRC